MYTNSNNIVDEVLGLQWYKSLPIHKRLALKQLCQSICGMRWEDFNILFSPRERIEIIGQKLRLEGFAI